MGLGLYIAAQFDGGAADEKLEGLANAFLRAIPDTALREFVRWDISDDRLSVDLHPCEESVEFWWGEEGLLRCSAKTSSCGPGYHAYLVNVLRTLADTLGFQWIVDHEDSEPEDEEQDVFCDETGFWRDNDFGELQRKMAKILGAILSHVTGMSGGDSRMISLPIGFPVALRQPPATMTSLGFRDDEWMREAVATDDRMLRAAAEYYPWWTEGCDALFWKRYGLVLAWTKLCWHPPQNDQEREKYVQASTAFKHAHDLEPLLVLPDREIAEIESLLDDDAVVDVASATDTTKIGYFRYSLRRDLTGGWSLVVPGYFYDGFEDDNTVVVLWNDDITVRATSYSVESETTRSALEIIGSPPDSEPGIEVIDDRADDPPGIGKIYFNSDDDNSYWVLRGDKGKPNGRCKLTVAFDNLSDRDAAIAIWKSLNHRR